MKDHFLMFARYNRWANRLLYAAAAELDDEQYRADRGAFFKSLHGTLNHLLLGDRVWMRRLTGEGHAYAALDLILFDKLELLQHAREAEDARIVDYVDKLTPARLAGSIRYTTVTSRLTFEQPLAPALAHFFNHQTHHRGQAHAILTSLVGHAPELDLLYFQRACGNGGGRLIA